MQNILWAVVASLFLAVLLRASLMSCSATCAKSPQVVAVQPTQCHGAQGRTLAESNSSRRLQPPASAYPSNEQWDSWINGVYEAPNKGNTAQCRNALRVGGVSPWSQGGQDVFLVHNYYRQMVMAGEKGFYVDGGANDPVKLSNTALFDICFGWEGICIEPNPNYAARFVQLRTCKHEKVCLSDKEKYVNFAMSSVMGHIGKELDAPAPGATHCEALYAILQRHNRFTVDFMSLDVEGHEPVVLSTVPFDKVMLRLLILEDFHLAMRPLDRHLMTNGFVQVAQAAIDAAYISIDGGLLRRANYFPEPIWTQFWDQNQKSRAADVKRGMHCN